LLWQAAFFDALATAENLTYFYPKQRKAASIAAFLPSFTHATDVAKSLGSGCAEKTNLFPALVKERLISLSDFRFIVSLPINFTQQILIQTITL